MSEHKLHNSIPEWIKRIVGGSGKKEEVKAVSITDLTMDYFGIPKEFKQLIKDLKQTNGEDDLVAEVIAKYPEDLVNKYRTWQKEQYGKALTPEKEGSKVADTQRSISTSYLESLIKENNEKYGTNFELHGAYGNYELWSGGNRIDVGSRKDIYNAFVKVRFNEKYTKPEATQKEASPASTPDNAFNKWFTTFLEEKNLSHQEWTIPGADGVDNFIDSDVVIEAIQNCSSLEQKKIKDMIVKIDFANGDVNDYFKHLAKGLIMTRGGSKEAQEEYSPKTKKLMDQPENKSITDRIDKRLKELRDKGKLPVQEEEGEVEGSKKSAGELKNVKELVDNSFSGRMPRPKTKPIENESVNKSAKANINVKADMTDEEAEKWQLEGWKVNIPEVIKAYRRVNQACDEQEINSLKLDLEEADSIDSAREILEQYNAESNIILDVLHKGDPGSVQGSKKADIENRSTEFDIIKEKIENNIREINRLAKDIDDAGGDYENDPKIKELEAEDDRLYSELEGIDATKAQEFAEWLDTYGGAIYPIDTEEKKADSELSTLSPEYYYKKGEALEEQYIASITPKLTPELAKDLSETSRVDMTMIEHENDDETLLRESSAVWMMIGDIVGKFLASPKKLVSVLKGLKAYTLEDNPNFRKEALDIFEKVANEFESALGSNGAKKEAKPKGKHDWLDKHIKEQAPSKVDPELSEITEQDEIDMAKEKALKEPKKATYDQNIPCVVYHWGEFLEVDVISIEEIADMEEVSSDALLGFTLRDEDTNKVFYSDSIDDDEDGISVKYAYGIDAHELQKLNKGSEKKSDKGYTTVSQTDQHPTSLPKGEKFHIHELNEGYFVVGNENNNQVSPQFTKREHAEQYMKELQDMKAKSDKSKPTPKKAGPTDNEYGYDPEDFMIGDRIEFIKAITPVDGEVSVPVGTLGIVDDNSEGVITVSLGAGFTEVPWDKAEEYIKLRYRGMGKDKKALKTELSVGSKVEVIKDLEATVGSDTKNPNGKSFTIPVGTILIYEDVAPNGNVWFTSVDGAERYKVQSGNITNLINSEKVKPYEETDKKASPTSDLSALAKEILAGDLSQIDITYIGSQDWSDADYADIVSNDEAVLDNISVLVAKGVTEGEISIMHINYPDASKNDHSADYETEEKGHWELIRGSGTHGSKKSAKLYSVYDEQTGQYLNTGRNSATRDEAINDAFEYYIGAGELSSEDMETVKKYDLKAKESLLVGVELVIEEHEEPVGDVGGVEAAKSTPKQKPGQKSKFPFGSVEWQKEQERLMDVKELTNEPLTDADRAYKETQEEHNKRLNREESWNSSNIQVRSSLVFPMLKCVADISVASDLLKLSYEDLPFYFKVKLAGEGKKKADAEEWGNPKFDEILKAIDQYLAKHKEGSEAGVVSVIEEEPLDTYSGTEYIWKGQVVMVDTFSGDIDTDKWSEVKKELGSLPYATDVSVEPHSGKIIVSFDIGGEGKKASFDMQECPNCGNDARITLGWSGRNHYECNGCDYTFIVEGGELVEVKDGEGKVVTLEDYASKKATLDWTDEDIKREIETAKKNIEDIKKQSPEEFKKDMASSGRFNKKITKEDLIKELEKGIEDLEKALVPEKDADKKKPNNPEIQKQIDDGTWSEEDENRRQDRIKEWKRDLRKDKERVKKIFNSKKVASPDKGWDGTSDEQLISLQQELSTAQPPLYEMKTIEEIKATLKSVELEMQTRGLEV